MSFRGGGVKIKGGGWSTYRLPPYSSVFQTRLFIAQHILKGNRPYTHTTKNKYHKKEGGVDAEEFHKGGRGGKATTRVFG